MRHDQWQNRTNWRSDSKLTLETIDLEAHVKLKCIPIDLSLGAANKVRGISVVNTQDNSNFDCP